MLDDLQKLAAEGANLTAYEVALRTSYCEYDDGETAEEVHVFLESL